MNRVKKTIQWTVALCTGLLFCAPFPTTYERIESDRVRLLDFTYKNVADSTLCEFAPGDTVLLEAYFAGKEVSSIDWDVSTDVVIDAYGEDSAFNVRPLAELNTRDTVITRAGFSRLSKYVSFTFVVPEDIFLTSRTLQSAQVDEVLSQLDISQSEIVSAIQLLAATPVDQRETVLGPQLYGQLEPFIPNILQLTTIPVRIFAKVNSVYSIKSDISVRYNRFFTDFENVFVNRNPRLRFFGLWKVAGTIDPTIYASDLDSKDTTFVFFSDGTPGDLYSGGVVCTHDTIEIDTGYSYYLVADTGMYNNVDLRDTALALIANEDDPVDITFSQFPETWYTQWFNQLDADEMDSVSVDDYPIVTSQGNAVEVFYPPLSTKITRMSLWVQAYDYYLGERFRPMGSDVKETGIYFTYSKAYADSLKKR